MSPEILEQKYQALEVHRLRLHETMTSLEMEQSKILAIQAVTVEVGQQLQERLAELQAITKTVTDARTQAEKEALGAGESNARAAEQAAEVARIRDESSQASQLSKASAEAAKAERDAVAVNATFVQDVRGQAEAALVALSTLRTNADEHLRAAEANSKATGPLAAVAIETEKRIKDYESRLSDLLVSSTADFEALSATAASQRTASEKALNDQLSKQAADAKDRTDAIVKKLEQLLPGATSTGLAAAFEARKEAVMKSQRFWVGTFALSLATLLGVGSVLFADTASMHGIDWQSALLMLIRRVPVLVPVLWLALFASKHLKVLYRLEEEYAHKVVMSNSFEGYKRELSDLPPGATGPIVDLTAAVLETLRRSPVPLHDGKSSSGSPLEALVELGSGGVEKATKFFEAVSKARSV